MRSLLNSQQVDDISQNELYQRGSLDCKDGPKYDVEHRENIDALYDDTTEQKKATLKEDGDVAQRLFASQNHEPIDSAEEARVVRKIDFMILPYLAVCYAFFYIDKTTLSYAAIFGIREDLKIHVCQAAATNFTTLAVLRALSGAAEASSDPAFMIITSMWYSRRQQPIRMYTANGFGIALGGLLGYGIGHIKAGLPSWKFEFLIIGALCSIWGIVMMIFLPDSPVTAKGLDEREKRIAVERLRDNQTGIENKHLKWYQVREAFTDYKTYLFFVLGFFGNVPNGGISNFGTIIIKGFGFSTLVTTLMQVPYGILIAISILVCVFLNDKFAANGRQTRCYFILLFLLPNISGSFGLAFLNADNKAGRLMCYYLTGPYNAAFVMVLSLTTANVAGHSKKVVTNAVLFLGYCAGNIAGPFFYKTSQSPRYQLGIWSMIVSHLAEVCIILLLRMLLSRENNRRDKIQSALPGGLEGRDLNATAFADLTDRENENFRYIY
ncbi:MFS general substrate transporter [Aureobasidium pullulans]|uniref:MFS general substrate transporter n=1 Tax=Aureobasidium pullulans TaxID=5580 RepID=A0A4S9BRY9_AURPU|nr:MFS general substrate transporter [Aureobasidium pullulans]